MKTNYSWKILVHTSTGFDCGCILETTKKVAIEKAKEAMPWMSKRFLNRVCYLVFTGSGE